MEYGRVKSATPPELVEQLSRYLASHRQDGYRVLHHYITLGKPLLLRSELHYAFRECCEQPGHANDELSNSALARLINSAEHAASQAPWIYFAVRPYVARWYYVRVHLDTMSVEAISVGEY